MTKNQAIQLFEERNELTNEWQRIGVQVGQQLPIDFWSTNYGLL